MMLISSVFTAVVIIILLLTKYELNDHLVNLNTFNSILFRRFLTVRRLIHLLGPQRHSGLRLLFKHCLNGLNGRLDEDISTIFIHDLHRKSKGLILMVGLFLVASSNF